jgi:CDGSH-type Zn-finger protein
VVTAVAVGYGIYATLRLRKRHVNPCLKKDCDKVVDSVDIEDIGEKAVFCRCWRSQKFPYCDGAHNKHNSETGDNVGPLIVKKKSN